MTQIFRVRWLLDPTYITFITRGTPRSAPYCTVSPPSDWTKAREETLFTSDATLQAASYTQRLAWKPPETKVGPPPAKARKTVPARKLHPRRAPRTLWGGGGRINVVGLAAFTVCRGTAECATGKTGRSSRRLAEESKNCVDKQLHSNKVRAVYIYFPTCSYKNPGQSKEKMRVV